MASLSLVELERWMHEAVKAKRPIDEAAEVLECDPGRLAIYQRMVEGHIFTALDGVFEALVRWIEPQRWQAICAAYIAERPPAHWSLNHAAEAFPEFLEACSQAGRLQVDALEVCLAQLEWEAMATALNDAVIPESSALEGPIINPTLSILAQPFELVQFSIALNAGEATRADAPAPLGTDAIVLLFQRPTTLGCAYYQADDELLFALKAVEAGLEASAAAELSGQPVAAVEAAYRRAIRIGLIVAP